jgi:hypothetical protein
MSAAFPLILTWTHSLPLVRPCGLRRCRIPFAASQAAKVSLGEKEQQLDIFAFAQTVRAAGRLQFAKTLGAFLPLPETERCGCGQAWLRRLVAGGGRDALVAQTNRFGFRFGRGSRRRGVADTLCDGGVAATYIRPSRFNCIVPTEGEEGRGEGRGGMHQP